ncbi:MAG: LamG-like jellyroll fold domain-containing protein [Flavobacteriales bacterium]
MRHLLTLLSIFTVLTLSAQVPSYVPTNGLVGWWPFNGNANDESGNGNNGVVNGATLTEDRFGNTDAAYSFDGVNDFISMSANLNSYSISLWFRYDNIPAQFGDLYHYENSYANITNDSLLYVRAQYPSPPSIGVITNYILIPVQWHHILVNYNAQTDVIDVFVENVNQYTSSSASGGVYNNWENNDTMYWGAFVLNNNNFFTGKLDDIGIWNRALDECEIQALYNAGAQGVSPTPVSFTGLNSSYILADQPSTLSGTPAGGVFIGPGVTGNTFDPASAGIGSHSIIYTYVDECGNANSAGFCTEVTVTSGVGGINMTTGGVLVYPNPNRGQFTVELELTGLVGMRIFDTRGALVHNEVFTASGGRTQRTLDLSTLAKGSYTLLVEHDGQRVSQTVVVE